MKKVLITGVTGQDGSYLAELLIEKGYEVCGLVRRSSQFNRTRIEHLYLYDNNRGKLNLMYGDLNDASSLNRVLEKVQPDEVYNLAAQSHVGISFEIPEYTAEITGVGTVRLLDAIRDMGISTKFYQASSSELFGNNPARPQNEHSTFDPRSPYACAKAYSYYITKNYREAYGLFACNGILFNHESPRRGESFVSRKITLSLARIKYGLHDKLVLGNLGAKRDWGHAKDYVYAMWLMLQQKQPDDYVIATGEIHSVREFTELAAKMLGWDIAWEGEGLNEKGIDRKTRKVLVEVSEKYFRPSDVECLIGDYSKAKEILRWRPEISFEQLVHTMIEADICVAEKELLLRKKT